jgi:hypothetical protein
MGLFKHNLNDAQVIEVAFLILGKKIKMKIKILIFLFFIFLIHKFIFYQFFAF